MDKVDYLTGQVQGLAHTPVQAGLDMSSHVQLKFTKLCQAYDFSAESEECGIWFARVIVWPVFEANKCYCSITFGANVGN